MRAGVGDEEEIEPVLGVVVVRAPAVAEYRIVALRTRVEERRPVGGGALHGDAEVLPPLRREVVADGLVECGRVVGVREVADRSRTPDRKSTRLNSSHR